MYHLKSGYNSPFKDSHSHPIHTFFPMIASNACNTQGRVSNPSCPKLSPTAVPTLFIALPCHLARGYWQGEETFPAGTAGHLLNILLQMIGCDRKEAPGWPADTASAVSVTSHGKRNNNRKLGRHLVSALSPSGRPTETVCLVLIFFSKTLMKLSVCKSLTTLCIYEKKSVGVSKFFLMLVSFFEWTIQNFLDGSGG